jgi:disulfide bond formation protein DsbB
MLMCVSHLSKYRDYQPFRLCLQDRIRAIAHGMGLVTIIWKYDSNDWRVGTNNITTADVDNAYNLFINNATAGTFNAGGGIMLTHELNNYTMSEAIKYYPQLKSSFSVGCIPHPEAAHSADLFSPVLGPHRCLPEQDTAIRRDELLVTDVPAVCVFLPRDSVVGAICCNGIAHSCLFFLDISGQVTVAGAVSNASSAGVSTISSISPTTTATPGRSKSSALSVTVSCGTWWTLLSAMILLSGLVS